MKVIDQLKQDVEAHLKKLEPNICKKYIRLTPSVKAEFIKTVIKGDQTLKSVKHMFESEGSPIDRYQLLVG